VERVRVFVALNLSSETRRALASVREMAPAGVPVRWVAVENIHLTLKFLGEVAGDRLAEIREAVERAAASGAAPRLVVRGLGAFPTRGMPRVLWAGVQEEHGRVAGLVETLEHTLNECGFPRERRPFAPHVTLGRIRSKPGSDRKGVGAWANELRSFLDRHGDVTYGEETVPAVSLMRSRLGPGGPRYEELGHLALHMAPENGG
jgi:2'-5' RNA ligase